MIVSRRDDLDPKMLPAVMDKLKAKVIKGVVVLATVNEQKIGLIVGIFGVLGSVIGGSLAFSIIPRDTLSISFGIFLTLVSVNMFISNK